MKKIVVYVALFLMLVGLCSCSKEEPEQEGAFHVYHLSNSETKIETKSYELKATSLEGQVEEILQALALPSEKLEYKPTLSYGFQIIGTDIKNNTLVLDVDEAYKNLPSSTEVLVRAALVNTLTQIEGISYVIMTVEGNQMYDNRGELIGRMNSEQFIYNDGNEINTFELKKIKLYFANEEGELLIPAYREKHYSTNVSIERFIVEEIIAGPSGKVPGLFPTVNPETKILAVTTKDGICYVNLDASFLTVVNNVPTDLAIYSIVNSLCELTSVNKVQILINGEVPANFGAAVYERNLDCILKE